MTYAIIFPFFCNSQDVRQMATADINNLLHKEFTNTLYICSTSNGPKLNMPNKWLVIVKPLIPDLKTAAAKHGLEQGLLPCTAK